MSSINPHLITNVLQCSRSSASNTERLRHFHRTHIAQLITSHHTTPSKFATSRRTCHWYCSPCLRGRGGVEAAFNPELGRQIAPPALAGMRRWYKALSRANLRSWVAAASTAGHPSAKGIVSSKECKNGRQWRRRIRLPSKAPSLGPDEGTPTFLRCKREKKHLGSQHPRQHIGCETEICCARRLTYSGRRGRSVCQARLKTLRHASAVAAPHERSNP